MKTNLGSAFRIALAGGGSGGHLRPLQAVATELESRGHQSFHLFPHGRMEDAWPEKTGTPCIFLKSGKFHRGAVPGRIWRILRAALEVDALFQKESWQAVLSTGGHAAFPVCLHAVLRGVPLFLIEPNRIAGKVNRWFRGWARRIYVHYQKPLGLTRNLLRSGTPLFLERSEFDIKPDSFLVFGASLGASSLNQFASKLCEYDLPGDLVWITGEKEYEAYRELQRESVRILPFMQGMASAYENAALVLCRPGASTVAELECFRVPAFCVPYPHHRDRQQELNCEHLVHAGACHLVEDSELKGLHEEVLKLWGDPQRLLEMRNAYPEKPVKSAAQIVAEDLLRGLQG